MHFNFAVMKSQNDGITNHGRTWQIQYSPTFSKQGRNSKSYGHFDPIPENTIHPGIVHVYTDLQLSSFLRF